MKKHILAVVCAFSLTVLSNNTHAQLGWQEIERGNDFIEYVATRTIDGFKNKRLRHYMTAQFRVVYTPARKNGLTTITYEKLFNCSTGDIKVSRIQYYSGPQHLKSDMKGTGEVFYNPSQTQFICTYKNTG